MFNTPVTDVSTVGNPFARFVDMPIQFLPHPLVPSGPIADKVDFGLGQKAIEPGSSDHSSRRREKQMPRAKTAAKRGSTAPTTDEKWLLSEESAGDETPEEAAPGFGAWPGKNPKAASTESTVGTPAPVPFSKPFPGFTGFNSQPATPSQRQQATSDLTTSGGNERSQLEADALSALAKLGYVGLTADDLGKLNPPDEYEEELNVMAEVRAYFQVAYKVRGDSSAVDGAMQTASCSVSSTTYHLPSTICSSSPLVRLCRHS